WAGLTATMASRGPTEQAHSILANNATGISATRCEVHADPRLSRRKLCLLPDDQLTTAADDLAHRVREDGAEEIALLFRRDHEAQGRSGGPYDICVRLALSGPALPLDSRRRAACYGREGH